MIAPESLAKEQRRVQHVFRSFEEAVWPFRFRDVRLYEDYDIDFNRYRILLEARFVSWSEHERYFGRIYLDRLDIENFGPEFVKMYISEEFFRLFRNLRLVEPEMNIILGEN